jgi:hypothetical protein
MPVHRSSTSTVVSGSCSLELHEELLLDQMTGPLPSCPDCGIDGMYLASWTPYRTVHRIVCAVCFHTFWSAP